jgi:hypothetical protein
MKPVESVIDRNAGTPRPDFTRAAQLTPEVAEAIDNAFEYQEWTERKIAQGRAVRVALAEAVKVIVENVPPCLDRTTAIRKIREARMDANSAITHDGRW